MMTKTENTLKLPERSKYVNAFFAVHVSRGVTRIRSTAAGPKLAGLTAVTTRSETTVNDAASVAPNFSDVALEKPVPVRVTVVPPATRSTERRR